MKRLVVAICLVLMLSGCEPIFAQNAQNPTTYNLTLTSANTEYSQVISPRTKKVTVQCRTAFAVRGAYETGKVATPTAPYFTIKAGAAYWEDGLSTKDTVTTLYLASSTAGVVVEIIVWR